MHVTVAPFASSQPALMSVTQRHALISETCDFEQKESRACDACFCDSTRQLSTFESGDRHDPAPDQINSTHSPICRFLYAKNSIIIKSSFRSVQEARPETRDRAIQVFRGAIL